MRRLATHQDLPTTPNNKNLAYAIMQFSSLAISLASMATLALSAPASSEQSLNPVYYCPSEAQTLACCQSTLSVNAGRDNCEPCKITSD